MDLKCFKGSDVLHIPTQEEALRVGAIVGNTINWELFKEKTCFRVVQGVCFSIDFCIECGYTIYPSIMIKGGSTLYQRWGRGEISNFGSFQTTLLQAYQIADSGNREKLEIAFPEWFVVKF
jgi:hypothetical protein